MTTSFMTIRRTLNVLAAGFALPGLAVSLLLAPPPAWGDAMEKFRRVAAPVPGKYIVVLDESLVPGDDAESVAAELTQAPDVEYEFVYSRVLSGFSASMSEEQAVATSADSRVDYVEEVAQMELAEETEATQVNPPWGLDRIDQRYRPLDGRFVYGRTGSGVNVYVVDTGITAGHAEFGSRASALFDFVGGVFPVGADCNGHGTHVAGTIGGGTVGVAKQVRLYGVRVLDCQGFGDSERITYALDQLTNYDLQYHSGEPSVVNMSIQGLPSSALDQAVRRSISYGLVYVIAAGNSSADASSSSPGRVSEAITVAASDGNDVKATFSNWGPIVDLFAPGVGIFSAWHTGYNHYATLNGTSMAAPHVAGAAALYLEGNRTASPATVQSWIKSQVTAVVVITPDVQAPTTTGLLYAAPPPAAPTSLSVTSACATRVDVAWQHGGANVSEFAVERRLASASSFGEIARLGAGARTYSDSGVQASSTYLYRVRARNTGSGWSAYSNEASGTAGPSVGSVGVTGSVPQSRPLSISWSSQGQSRYSLYLYNASGTAPVDTSYWGGGTDGFIKTATSSSARSDSWTVPRDMPLGTYSIRIVVFDACGGSAPALSPAFSVTTRVTIGLVAGSSTAWEGSGSAAVAVILTTLDGTPTTWAVSVPFNTTSGTAALSSDGCSSGDYRTPAGNPVSFGSGTGSNTVRNISVPLCGDSLDEFDETLTLALSAPSGANLGSITSHVLTVADDDPPPSITIADVVVGEGNGGGISAVFTVSLSAPSGKTVQVSYQTADGTAKSGADYTPAGGTLSFSPGSTSRQISVGVKGDHLDEDDEVFTVALSGPSNATLARSQATGSIRDDDAPPAVSINHAAALEGTTGAGGVATFRVRLSAASGRLVTIDYATADNSAVAGADYTSVSGTLSLPPGTIEAGIAVSALADADTEGNETFLVVLSNPTNLTLADGLGQGTIFDDEGSCSYAIDPASAAFGRPGGTGNVSVSAADGCAWWAVSTERWLTLPGAAEGAGNGSVPFSVAPNTSGRDRTATLFVQGLVFSVTSGASQGVVFKDLVKAAASSNTLTKSGSADAWDAGAVSTKSIVVGDGYVEFTTNDASTRQAGLSNGNTDAGEADVDFAIGLTSNGQIRVKENGVNLKNPATGDNSFGNYATGDRFRVSVEAGLVKYRRNGALLHTSEVAPDYPLLVDTSLRTPGASLDDVALAGDFGSNQVPAAKAGGPYAGAVGSAIQFDASASSDPDGVIVSYSWAFGDGQAGVGRSPTHAYAAAGNYTVTLIVTDDEGATATVSTTAAVTVGTPVSTENVVWTSLVKASASGNTLTKAGTANAWDAGAVSTRAIAAGNGYVEFTANGVTQRQCGLSNGNTDAGEADVDFAIGLTAGGSIRIKENGARQTNTANGTQSFGAYVSGDVFRVSVEGGSVKYRKNGVLLYTSTAPPVYPLLVDTSMETPGAIIANAVISGDFGGGATNQAPVANAGGPYTGTVGATIQFDGTGSSDSDGVIVSYSWAFGDGQTGSGPTPTHAYAAAGTYPVTLTVTDHGGATATASGSVTVTSGTPTSTENVVWTSLVKASASGNTLTKTGTATAWDAGAVSSRALVSGDGHVEFTANGTTQRQCGLSNGNTDAGEADVDFAIGLTAGGLIRIKENGARQTNPADGTQSFGAYASGDVFRVSVESGSVKYRKNGVLLYTSTAPPVYPLLVDTSMETPGAMIANAVISGDLE